MTLLALFVPSLSGGLLSWWASVLRLWFGAGSIWVFLGLTVAAILILNDRPKLTSNRYFWERLLALEVAAFFSMALLTTLGGNSLERAESGQDGGRIGWGLAELLHFFLQPLGLSSWVWQALTLSILFVLLIAFGTGVTKRIALWAQKSAQDLSAYHEIPGILSESNLTVPDKAVHSMEKEQKRPVRLPPQFRKSFRLDDQPPETPAIPFVRDTHLPGFDILVNEQITKPDERNINLTAGLIEKSLSDLGIPARVVGFKIGPTVTQFAVEPGYLEKEKPGLEGDMNRQKVRVAQISSLSRDLALALSAERLRIEAPVPGRPYVGIEVPNSRSSIVRLRPILESEAFSKTSSPLAIALGRDVSGQPVVADLGRMPHLLIAGTTGSGKSVCIAALTTCLAMNNTPEDLRLVMIDPKMVELVRFNGLPHVYGKVETELERILTVLRWTVAEMDRRYKILEASHSRNLDSYNRKARRKKGEEPLPRIIVMIDELADLMMSAPDQTEHTLVRLAQMARATGIHLVVATQRPGTEIVTGLIKANFPARISFSVASSIDSRVVLDTTGAEALLGRGDMLFLAPDASAPVRLQGVMVSDQEVEHVITFWQTALPNSAEIGPSPWETMVSQDSVFADRDGLIQKAIEIVRKERRASASLLQRRLRIGYPRAAHLIDEMEELGAVGPAVAGGREREVLLDEDEWIGQVEDQAGL